jgi:hypothetical protein
MTRIPPEIQNWVMNALLDLVHPSLRCVSVGYSEKKELIVNFYVDRPKLQFDDEVAEVFFETFLSHLSSNEYFNSTNYNVIHFVSKITEKEKLSFFAFKRMEHWVSDDGTEYYFGGAISVENQ